MNVHASAPEAPARRRFTVSDFFFMAEQGILRRDERLEMVDGEIIVMSPKGSRHERLRAAILRRWRRACPDDHDFLIETGLRLSEGFYVEPDFVVWASMKMVDQLTGPDILLVVELADSSLDYDLHRKPLIYARFGVPELWVVDAARRTVHVHRDPGEEGYASVVEVDTATRLEPIVAPRELAFTLDDLQPV